MNEQILLNLAAQAFDTVKPTDKEWFKSYSIKFAELIVRECRVTMSENFHECKTAPLMDKVIKEHFGIDK